MASGQKLRFDEAAVEQVQAAVVGLAADSYAAAALLAAFGGAETGAAQAALSGYLCTGDGALRIAAARALFQVEQPAAATIAALP